MHGTGAGAGRTHPSEIQSTILEYAMPNSMALLHPDQDHVLTVRDNA